MKWPLIACSLVCILNQGITSSTESDGRSRRSLLTPKNLHTVAEYVLPFLMPSKPDEARKDSTSVHKLMNTLQGALSSSAKEDEDWLTFGKRLASYYVTGSKKFQKNDKLLNAELAKIIYKKSPKLLKESLKAQLGGSLLPIIEKNIDNIIKTMVEKNGTIINAEGKQGTVVFDPVVFGVNSLINLFWFAAFNAAVLPRMGIDNLFYPDYDFDYDALDEEEEEEEYEDEEEEEEEEHEEGSHPEDAEGEHEHSTYTSYQQSHQATHQQQPHQATHLPDPHKVSLQQLPNQASHHQQPNQASHHQQPTQASHHQQPNQASHHQQPNQVSHHQQPTQASHHQQPNQASHHQQPTQASHHQQPTQASHHQQPNQATHHQQPQQHTPPQELSSYMYYPGQRMQLHPNQISRDAPHKRKFNLLKMR